MRGDYDFTCWAHRVRWWAGYYLKPWWCSVFVCELRGHRTVVSVDYSDGFNTVWCKRCGEVLRG